MKIKLGTLEVEPISCAIGVAILWLLFTFFTIVGLAWLLLEVVVQVFQAPARVLARIRKGAP